MPLVISELNVKSLTLIFIMCLIKLVLVLKFNELIWYWKIEINVQISVF